MKEYEKPIVQIIDFASEEILDAGGIGEDLSTEAGTGDSPFG